MKKPNLFIVGAPKCGTTALHTYLAQVAAVFACDPKEPHYFVQNDFPNWWKRSEADYLALFEDARDESYLLDSSVWHLYSRSAMKQIYNYNSDAKVIVMVRKPVEMVSSCHAENFKNRQENIKDLVVAWSQNQYRKNGCLVPATCRAKEILFYDEVAKYGEQLERVYRYFSREQVHVIFFDDFKANTKHCFEKVLEFLGVEHKGAIDFSPVNEAKSIRSAYLADFTRGHPVWLFKIYNTVKKILGFKELGLLQFVRNKNEFEKKRERVSDDLSDAIIRNYIHDIELLETLTGRDLSSWKKK